MTAVNFTNLATRWLSLMSVFKKISRLPHSTQNTDWVVHDQVNP